MKDLGKRGIFVFLALILILSIGISFASAFWPFDNFKKTPISGNLVKDVSYLNTATCADSDGGIYARIPGNVTYKKGVKTYNVSDRCLSKSEIAKYYRKNANDVQNMSVLTEWYCKNGRHTSMVVKCDEGTTCQETLEGAACVPKTDISNSDWFDIGVFGELSEPQKTQALKEAKTLQDKYRKYWNSDVFESEEAKSFYNKVSGEVDIAKLNEYMGNRWHKQKQSHLDEFALRNKYGLLYENVNYEEYISSMNNLWDEQEKQQSLKQQSSTSINNRITGLVWASVPGCDNIFHTMTYNSPTVFIHEGIPIFNSVITMTFGDVGISTYDENTGKLKVAYCANNILMYKDESGYIVKTYHIRSCGGRNYRYIGIIPTSSSNIGYDACTYDNAEEDSETGAIVKHNYGHNHELWISSFDFFLNDDHYGPVCVEDRYFDFSTGSLRYSYRNTLKPNKCNDIGKEMSYEGIRVLNTDRIKWIDYST